MHRLLKIGYIGIDSNTEVRARLHNSLVCTARYTPFSVSTTGREVIHLLRGGIDTRRIDRFILNEYYLFQVEPRYMVIQDEPYWVHTETHRHSYSWGLRQGNLHTKYSHLRRSNVNPTPLEYNYPELVLYQSILTDNTRTICTNGYIPGERFLFYRHPEKTQPTVYYKQFKVGYLKTNCTISFNNQPHLQEVFDRTCNPDKQLMRQAMYG